ncbi:SRPBCC family protein [Paeniglutamicibacter cryotolerans]|uniref:SRPBCC domain-containing protein n=1 Tax=Paeniglutamicibacter cryotolerans TaxID=670079 RepID=A0A839QES5_9MICC|nr:SRPBCC domain-containing protein [Paeniglutamicibacter cryotolerans]MBB2994113.1 hypothetical protein [Paeniglutamicibacter cryotolerans]
MSREFEIIHDSVLPATPERIWEAVTAGTPAWMFPTDQWPVARTVEEHPTHLVTRMEGPDGWYNQLEHVLTPGDQGTALHYVHSGIFVDDWDQQYDAASKHTAFYLHTLGQYLLHFDGRPVVFCEVQGPAAAVAPGALDTLLAALGLADVVAGQDVNLQLPGLGRVDAVVDFGNENFLGLRTDDAMVRIFGRNAFGARVGLTVHDFAPGADAAATSGAWNGYLESVFAAPTA